MNKQTKIIGALLGAALAAASGVAVAESSYGYQSSGTGAVQATARVNLAVTVPKLILLRVGSATGTGDTITWTGAASWNTNPSPVTDGNNQAADWDGAQPSINLTSSTNALAVYAWQNSGSNATLTFTSTAFAPTGGPLLSNVAVGASGLNPPSHPGGTLDAATSVNLITNTLYSGTWTYTLGGSAYTWAAGSYNGAVTYTASAL